MTTVSPTYFGAVVTTEEGDARIMCMVQEGSTASVHFFNVDTSLDELELDFPIEERVGFGEELRRFGLAVMMLDGEEMDLPTVIEGKLREVYGPQASVRLVEIERPTIASLFLS